MTKKGTSIGWTEGVGMTDSKQVTGSDEDMKNHVQIDRVRDSDGHPGTDRLTDVYRDNAYIKTSEKYYQE